LKHVFSENNVSEIYKAKDRSQGFLTFFENYYRKLGLKDLLEQNELSIMTMFCIYNLEFAKVKLRLPDDKAALIMNILFPFVSFRHLDSKDQIGCYIPPEEWSDEKVKQKLSQKYEYLQIALLTFAKDNPPKSMKVFDPDVLIQILDYVSKTYFEHFALFACATGQMQKVKEKRMTLYMDEPISTPPLKEANLIPNKEKEAKNAKAEAKKTEEKKPDEKIAEQKEEKKKSEKKEEEVKSVEKMIDSLVLSEEGKQSIYNKIKEMKEEMELKLAERQKKLEEKLEESKPKGKKKK